MTCAWLTPAGWAEVRPRHRGVGLSGLVRSLSEPSDRGQTVIRPAPFFLVVAVVLAIGLFLLINVTESPALAAGLAFAGILVGAAVVLLVRLARSLTLHR